MLIDCNECAAQHTRACRDCVVTHLLSDTAGVVEVGRRPGRGARGPGRLRADPAVAPGAPGGQRLSPPTLAGWTWSPPCVPPPPRPGWRRWGSPRRRPSRRCAGPWRSGWPPDGTGGCASPSPTRPGPPTLGRRSPGRESLVVAAHAYLPASGNPGPASPGTGRVARFATADHYRPLRAGLGALAGVLQAAGHRAEVLCDDSRLVDRAAAVRAGVGWWGKSTMVLAPGHGPWLLLGSVVTDASLPAGRPHGPRLRRRATACLPACPTGALVAPGGPRRPALPGGPGPGAGGHPPRVAPARHGRSPLRLRRLPGGLPAGAPGPGRGRRRSARGGWTCSTCWRPTTTPCCGASPTSTCRAGRPATCGATPWWPWGTPGGRGRWRRPPGS